MARQPDGQIQPVARPVQAFIEPVRVSIAEPARPAQLPGLAAPQIVQQGGMPSVQGENPFERLAGSLAAFNQQLTPALQAAGVAFVDQQIKQGEARARAAALQGLAQNDASMETAEQDRAKANRALARRDPAAAGIMALLNPYAQVGYERGLARLAGAEAATGLPAYIKERGQQIDYLAPDQGQGSARRLANEYASQLMQRYGLSADNPATQRFVIPEIEKAREKVGLEILKDRQEYLTSKRIDSTAGLMRNFYAGSMKEGSVEYRGQSYDLKDPIPERRQIALQALRGRLQEYLDYATKLGVLPGDGRAIQGKIYKQLARMGWYKDEDFQRIVSSLDSTDKVLDEKGRELLDPVTQKPVYMKLGSVYMEDDIEAEIKYRAAAAAQRRDQRELMMTSTWTDRNGGRVEGFENYIFARLSRFAPGTQEYAQAGALAVLDYWNRYKAELFAAGVTLPALEKKRKEVADLKSELTFAATDDPDMPSRELGQLDQIRGSNWNANQLYKRGMFLAAQIKNPTERDKFKRDWDNKVNRLDKENTSLAGYKEARDAVIGQRINAELNNYYPAANQLTQGDRSVSRSRQYEAYVPYANAAISDAEAKKGSRLNDAEVRKVVSDALNQYGKGPDGRPQKDFLFPGSPMTRTPSVNPYQKPTNNNGSPPPAEGAKPKPPPPRVFNVSELDTMADRKLVLRSYEDRAVLSHGAVRQLIDAVGQDKPWPKEFERAWRDSGARTPGEFLESQIKRYPGQFVLPPELQRKVMKRSSVQTGISDNLVSVQSMQQRFPSLAVLAGGALDLLTGASPAMASARYSEMGPGDPAAGPSRAMSHPTLTTLAAGRLVPAPKGYCTTAVLKTLAANGLPNPQGTGDDSGNNPRGLASQLVRSYGWQSLPGLGQQQIIRSRYGAFAANVIPEPEYLAAVKAGRIPSGALVFSTRHGSWQGASPGSRGYDVAVARNGGRNLWNGYLSGMDVYSGGSKLRMVLVPAGSTLQNSSLSRN